MGGRETKLLENLKCWLKNKTPGYKVTENLLVMF